MNGGGTSVLERHVSEAIEKLDKSDEATDEHVREGAKLGIRLGEAALKATVRNRMLLYVILIVLILKPEDMNVLKFLFTLFGL